MNDTQVLLSKIAALRQRLEQAQGVGHSAAGLPPPAENGPRTAPRTSRAALERQIYAGARHSALLDAAIRPLPEPGSPPTEPSGTPRQLTARARRLLEVGRELLVRLRTLADDPLLQADESNPLAVRYRETVAMTDTALRMVQAYPEAASVQLRLCEGLEATLQVIAERVTALRATLDDRRREHAHVDTLAGLLIDLEVGKSHDLKPFLTLAEALLAEAQQLAPLRIYQGEADRPARFVACHSLNVAQVAARLVRHDAELRSQAVELVLAALVHDAGMLRIPVEILNQRGTWGDKERQAVEAHTRIGAQLAARLQPTGPLTEAAAGHHERMDGTGYPAGLREMQIPPLVRLLAVCDVYAALCAPRPHRAAQEPRTALTDTLLLAEKGALDRHHAEHLLQLSFYPIGSVVELADGTVGVVVATHMGRRDLNTPARPVLALLTTAQGQPLPMPRHVDLAQWEGGAIVRTLSPVERRRLLGRHYLDMA